MDLELSLALFPGPTQLSVASVVQSDRKLGGLISLVPFSLPTALYDVSIIQEFEIHCNKSYAFKVTILTTIWDSSPHLSVTPVQLMRPGIGQHASYAVGDFA